MRDTDNTAFNSQWASPTAGGSAQVCTGSSTSGLQVQLHNSIEIALDVEYAHARRRRPHLNYMAASTSDASFTTMYNRIVTTTRPRRLHHWGACEVGLSAASHGPTTTSSPTRTHRQSWFRLRGQPAGL